jgi:uncharacterized protein YdhG (YjbR/CyaY superfamily)
MEREGNQSVTTVDEYLALQPEPARAVLQKVRMAIRKAIPKADETISYQIPAYKLNGRTVIFFAGWQKHYSLYPVSAEVLANLQDDLSAYQVKNGTIRFPLFDPVPERFIARIARLLAKSRLGSDPQK